MNSTRQQQLITSYNQQLSSRFQSNSMALQVLLCLVLILILVIEIIKTVKKTYEWQTEYEMNLEQRYAMDDIKQMIKREQSAQTLDNDRRFSHEKAEKTIPEPENPPPNSAIQRNTIKKEIYMPPLVRVEEILKNKLPQLAIIAVNIVMLSSYEFLSISAYITIVLIIISEILGLKEAEHLNLRFILQILAKLLMIAWYINMLTVGKPRPS